MKSHCVLPFEIRAEKTGRCINTDLDVYCSRAQIKEPKPYLPFILVFDSHVHIIFFGECVQGAGEGGDRVGWWLSRHLTNLDKAGMGGSYCGKIEILLQLTTTTTTMYCNSL